MKTESMEPTMNETKTATTVEPTKSQQLPDDSVSRKSVLAALSILEDGEQSQEGKAALMAAYRVILKL